MFVFAECCLVLFGITNLIYCVGFTSCFLVVLVFFVVVAFIFCYF